MKHIITQRSLILASTLLVAGTFAGNAIPSAHADGFKDYRGSGILCVGSSSELLDYYEAKLTTDLKIDFGPASSSYQDRIAYVLNRYAKIDPVAAARFASEAKDFEKEARFVSSDNLRDVSELKEIDIPTQGCNKRQFSAQNFGVKPDQARYLVDQGLWNTANSETKAGLVLHELIYRDTVATANAKTSETARYLNAQVCSTKIETLSGADYYTVMSNIGLVNNYFSRYEDSLPVYLSSYEFTNLASTTSIEYKSGGQDIQISGYGSLTFDNNEKLVSAQIDTTLRFGSLSVPLSGAPYSLADKTMKLVNKNPYESTTYGTQNAVDGTEPTFAIGGNTYKSFSEVILSSDQSGNPVFQSFVVDPIDPSQDPQHLNFGKIAVSFSTMATVVISGNSTVSEIKGTTVNYQLHAFQANIQVASQSFTISDIKIGQNDLSLTLDQDETLVTDGKQHSFSKGDVLKYRFDGVFEEYSNEVSAVAVVGETVPTSGSTTYYPSGAVKCFVSPQVFSWTSGKQTNTLYEEICLYETGEIKSGTITPGDKLPIGGKLEQVEGGPIVLYQDGELAIGSSDKKHKVQSPNCAKAGFAVDIDSNTNHAHVYDKQGRTCKYDPNANIDLDQALNILNQ